MMKPVKLLATNPEGGFTPIGTITIPVEQLTSLVTSMEPDTRGLALILSGQAEEAALLRKLQTPVTQKL